jgi:two-component system, cell cycle sensor histidine kinase and response regulator CckA
VYGIVTQAGGHVDIYSEPDRGTTIKVYLPAVGGRPEAPVESGRAKPPQGHGETILLVEDKDAVRASTRRILEQAGYRVLEAADGDEALRVAATADELDLLLSDVVMPGMSGRLVAERVLALRPGTRVVLMSGFTDEQLEAGDGAGGGPGFLEKPFSPDRLLAVTRRALDARDPG